MESPLRLVRKSKKLDLRELSSMLSKFESTKASHSYLSMVERGICWPQKKLVEALVKVFDGDISEMEILFPERFTSEEG